MLYSLNYMKNRRHERRLFYAESDGEVKDMVLVYAERTGLLSKDIWIEEHPRGFFIEGKLFPRFMPAEEKKRERA
jgi:hypothetical protein